MKLLQGEIIFSKRSVRLRQPNSCRDVGRIQSQRLQQIVDGRGDVSSLFMRDATVSKIQAFERREANSAFDVGQSFLIAVQGRIGYRPIVVCRRTSGFVAERRRAVVDGPFVVPQTDPGVCPLRVGGGPPWPKLNGPRTELRRFVKLTALHRGICFADELPHTEIAGAENRLNRDHPKLMARRRRNERRVYSNARRFLLQRSHDG
ncbi:MAG TPA: hypothetical protein VF278_11635 [Pirellulales bacterium]